MSSRILLQHRARCPKPQATASSDVKTDDTVEARRRLARQFRKHKLEPQPANRSVAQATPTLRPKPQRVLDPHWKQFAGTDASSLASLAAVEVGQYATAEPLLQRLERQFRLGPASTPLSNRQSSGNLQLTPSLLSDASLSEPGSEITKAINRAQDWRQVQSLVQEHAPALNTIHICACITRLVQLQDSFCDTQQAGEFLQQLLDSVAGVQHSLTHRQVCNILWAMSKLQGLSQPRQQLPETLYQLAMSHPVQQEGEVRTLLRETAQLAYSLVGLQVQLPQQLVLDVASRVLETTQTLLQDSLHLQEQAQRQQKQQPVRSGQQEQLIQQDSLQELQHAATQVQARDLATVAWSIASLEVQPSTAWLSAFASAMSCRRLMAHANYRDLSTLLWATAKFSNATAEGSAASNSVHAAAGALLQVCQETSFRSCDAQSLSNTLWALATLSQRPSVGWLNRLLHHLEVTAVQSMQPQGLSNCLWALAALGVVPQRSCMDALLSAVASTMQQSHAQGISNVIWALAVLEHQPSKSWQADFWRHSRHMLAQMTAQGLVNCLWSVARLGLQPPQEWVVDVAKLLIQQGVGTLSTQGLHNVLWAAARLNNGGKPKQELLEMAIEQSNARLEQQQAQGSGSVFTIYELSGLMHTVSLLQASEHTAVPQLDTQVPAVQPAANSSQGTGRSRSPSPSRPVANNSDASSAKTEPRSPLSRLASLLQSSSLPLLPAAGASELSILLWSQVSMMVGSRQSPAEPGLAIPRAWMDAWLQATQASFGSASSRDLAQWLWCLAKRGVRPNAQWIASYQVASYRQMGRANSQDLSNMLWALASLGITPEPAWLQQLLQEVSRRQAQKQLLPQHLANLGWALAKLGHRPDRDWSARYQEDVCSGLSRFKPQELTNVLWSLAVLNCKAERGFISRCLSLMADRLISYKANEVAVSLWAVARLRGQPDMRLMAAALQHCFTQARQLSPKGLSMLMWSVGNMATPPPKSWVAKLLVATQVRMSGFSTQELSMLAVSLARLEYRPPDAWLDCFASAAAAQMSSFEAQALANTLWALATLHYTPTEAWMNAFDSQLQKHLASFTPAHTAMTMWAMSRLQWLPEQPLWQQLQERAELHSASYCLRSMRMLQRAVRVLEGMDTEDY